MYATSRAGIFEWIYMTLDYQQEATENNGVELPDSTQICKKVLGTIVRLHN
jgi:hypothetical protein